MDKQICGRPATVQFFWGSELQKMCEGHARAVAAVGQAIGFPVMLAHYDGDDVCTSQDQHPDDRDNTTE